MSHRLNKITREFNIGIHTIVEFLAKKGHKIDSNPNTKLSDELYTLLVNEFSSEKKVKRESSSVNLEVSRKKKESITLADVKEEEGEDENEESADEAKSSFDIKVVGKIDLNQRPKPKVEPVAAKPLAKPEPVIETVAPVVDDVFEEADDEPVDEEVRAEFDEQGGDYEDDFSDENGDDEEDGEFNDEEVIDALDDDTNEEVDVIEEDGNLIRVPRTKIENNVKVIGKIDLTSLNQKTRPDKKSKEQKDKERRDRRDKDRRPGDNRPAAPAKAADAKPVVRSGVNNTIERPVKEPRERIAPPQPRDRQAAPEEVAYRPRVERLSGPTVVGKIELERNVSNDNSDDPDRPKRKRILKEKVDPTVVPATPLDLEAAARNKAAGNKKKKKKFERREEVSAEDVDKQVKETLTLLGTKSKSKSVKLRREKRDAIRQEMEDEAMRQEEESMILKVTEFISVNDISIMMDVQVNEVISACMKLGLFVSINQRLDADTISVIAEEFGFSTEFVSVEVQEAIQQEEDPEDSLITRPPIVTVMGHVDHGKTSLLDHIRSANVIAGEAGGITQHIGAYSVALPDGRKISFLDTPGHEAFTAMRARGAQVTDLAIIVVAADDSVMPQTIEAINHAAAAGVPMIFAINKIDKPGANPEKIKEQLANMNYLVEDWGGKFQSQEISAKKGVNVDTLLEKVLLEAEMLQLRANPDKRAIGTIIESELDKGRGYVSTVLVQAGTLKVGDIILAGHLMGKVKAMFNERGARVKEAGPSEPVTILGLNGAPQAGDRFNVMATEKEAKELASKREQLQREQELRTHRHITLDEIGRRIAVGNFQQLNLIVKGDVDGSVEALSDSLIKLSHEEIMVNVIHKAVGGITESDVMLASASDAIIVGFQVRPSGGSRRLAEKEGIDIRLYSIIYDAINEIKDAMMGMLKPIMKEEIVATLEVREAFKITKVGTVAGCFVQDGKITRHSKVRIIRDGIVVYSGDLGSLKRFKDDVRDVSRGMECGLNIHNYNDIKVGDFIEAYEQKEVQRTSL